MYLFLRLQRPNRDSRLSPAGSRYRRIRIEAPGVPRLQAKPNYVQSTVAGYIIIEVSGRKKKGTVMYFDGGATSTVDAEMKDCRYWLLF